METLLWFCPGCGRSLWGQHRELLWWLWCRSHIDVLTLPQQEIFVCTALEDLIQILSTALSHTQVMNLQACVQLEQGDYFHIILWTLLNSLSSSSTSYVSLDTSCVTLIASSLGALLHRFMRVGKYLNFSSGKSCRVGNSCCWELMGMSLSQTRPGIQMLLLIGWTFRDILAISNSPSNPTQGLTFCEWFKEFQSFTRGFQLDSVKQVSNWLFST